MRGASSERGERARILLRRYTWEHRARNKRLPFAYMCVSAALMSDAYNYDAPRGASMLHCALLS